MKSVLLSAAVAAPLLSLQAQWGTNLVKVEDGGFFLRGNDRTLKQIEKIYAGMPPLNYTPPPGRWKRLPRAAQCLQNGPLLRVVMLGDSIITDTSRSGWDLLTQARYPGCRIEKTTSVRGSTGCWWYNENDRVKPFVLDHQPDLLIIGGISQREDIDSIREVIRQVRAGGCRADVLLMTGAFGKVDPRDEKQWQAQIDPGGNDYRARLQRLADEVGAAFLDMSAAWGRYVRESGRELDWFKRDAVHANERGDQILGRILDRYLSPEDDGGGASSEAPGGPSNAAAAYEAGIIFLPHPRHNHAPGMVECPNGSLLVSWYRAAVAITSQALE